MQRDANSIELVPVRDMKTAAVLDAYGFQMKSARAEPEGDKVRVVFSYMVNPDRRQHFDRICELCQAGYKLPIVMSREQIDSIADSDNGDVRLRQVPTLGDYERHFAGVRQIIDDLTKNMEASETDDE